MKPSLFYTALMGRMLGSRQIDDITMPYHPIYRIGFAPYKGKYDQLHKRGWLLK